MNAVYVQHFDKIKFFVLQNNGSEDDAKDVYQDAFVTVWRNIQLDKFKPQNETSLGGYIYQIAKYKWIDQLRSVKYKKTIPLAEANIAFIEEETLADDDVEYIEAVKANYRQLGDQCKKLLNLFYFEKESMREIAVHFSWTEASAKNNKYRCLQKLREMTNTKDSQ